VPSHHLEMDEVSFYLVGTIRIKHFGSQMSALLVNNTASDFFLMLKYCKILPRRLFFCPCLFGDFGASCLHLHTVNDLAFVLLFCSR